MTKWRSSFFSWLRLHLCHFWSILSSPSGTPHSHLFHYFFSKVNFIWAPRHSKLPTSQVSNPDWFLPTNSDLFSFIWNFITQEGHKRWLNQNLIRALKSTSIPPRQIYHPESMKRFSLAYELVTPVLHIHTWIIHTCSCSLVTSATMTPSHSLSSIHMRRTHLPTHFSLSAPKRSINNI